MYLSSIKDKLIETLDGLGVFRTIGVLERKALSPAINYPAAHVFCLEKRKQSRQGGRKPYTVRFTVEVSAQNLKSEGAASLDCDALAELVEDAIDGKDLGLEQIMPFDHAGTEFRDYDPALGVISYWIYLETVLFKRR